MRIDDVEFDRYNQYDLTVLACGYETRATYAIRSAPQSGAVLAIDYNCPGLISYDSNRAWLLDNGSALVDEEIAVDSISAAIASDRSIRVDISSMKRSTIANLVEACARSKGARVEFVYTPAMYESSLEAASAEHTLSAGPVSRYFLGELRPSSISLGLIAGLGLEPHRILGLSELLEPSKVWALQAQSDDLRFRDRVLEVNDAVVGRPDVSVLPYDIRSMASTYLALESLVFGASRKYRVVIAPSGPKMLALVAMIAAARSDPAPAVWRVGPSEAGAVPVDVTPAGDVVAAMVDFD